MELLRRHVTFANLVSAMALFVALGGSSYAAISDTGHGDAHSASPPPAADPTGPAAPSAAGDEGVEEVAPTSAATAPLVVPEGGISTATGEALGPSGSGATAGPPDVRAEPAEAALDSERKTKVKRLPENRDAASGEQGDGPPPWAPAHGYRCKQAGNAPGSPQFEDCVQSRKR
jgi:hypothetical protein